MFVSDIPNKLIVPQYYKDALGIIDLRAECATLSMDDEVRKYVFKMLLRQSIEQKLLFSRQPTEWQVPNLELTKEALAEALGDRKEQRFHVAQIERGPCIQSNTGDLLVPLLLSIADEAIGRVIESRVQENSNQNIPFGYVVTQGFTTEQRYQLPPEVLRNSAIEHGIGPGGWKKAYFRIDGGGYVGELFGYTSILEPMKNFDAGQICILGEN